MSVIQIAPDRELGSLQNLMYDAMKQPAPEVGMGVTILMWTDRSAGTIVKVINSTRIVIQGDISTRVDSNGMSDCQTYSYERNPDACEVEYTLRSNGRWVQRGWKQSMPGLSLGHRDAHHDYSF